MAFNPRQQLPAGELRLFTRKLAIVVAAILILALLWAVRFVLILLFIAAVLAAGISPAVWRVRVLGRFYLHRNIPRGTAALIVYFPFLAVVLSLAIFLIPRLIDETSELREDAPALIEQNVLTPLERYIPVGPLREHIKEGIDIPDANIFGYVRGVASAVAAVVALLFLVAYMLIDAEKLRNTILLFYPPDVRSERRIILNRVAQRMSSWLAGQLILCGVIGAATFAGLLLLRIPYALPLAILAAVGELVPVIGPIVGTAPALAIALLHSRWQFWAVLVFAVLLQKLENLFIAPRVMSKKVSISPLAAFIAFMVGATLLGVVGAIMAIPIAAILHVAFQEVFVSRRERRLDVERSGTLLRQVD